MPMLQDLDSLAARIGQMVALARELQSERTTLLARIKTLESDRDQLTQRLQRREADFNTMAGSLAEHESQLQVIQDQAQTAQSQLQLELDECRHRCSAAEQQLLDSQADAQRLRTVSEAARQQIDSILERLPGATQE